MHVANQQNEQDGTPTLRLRTFDVALALQTFLAYEPPVQNGDIIQKPCNIMQHYFRDEKTSNPFLKHNSVKLRQLG